ncbi:hypothetical protein SeMB42_g07024 [Synchytrium endobioticum]|uniref:LisH domain-containing protein n=1 Tax=Synchytrium endobioticum TaxID=286115 RepID=A0A507CFQ9_9FUNG|nr:hypothetical protein SeMB42_g07024 [Synchytrium endobioticum]
MEETKERHINYLIREFLAYAEYTSTLASFDAECLEHDRTPVQASETVHDSYDETHLTVAFRVGDRASFFKHFDQVMPPETRIDGSLKLIKNPVSCMDEFKVFLEKREVFDPKWAPELEERLAAIVKSRATARMPTLITVLDGSDGRSAEQVQAQTAEIQQLKAQIHDMEESQRRSASRQRELQSDHHNLIAIASELVQALAACINGEQITPAYLTNICDRLVELRRNHQVLDQASRLPPPASANARPPPKRSTNCNLDSQLDYTTIRKQLMEESHDQSQRRDLLLQALRLRLTRAPDARTRQATLSIFIQSDCLGLAQGSVTTALSLLKSSRTKGQFARLLNAMSSGCSGRSYLLSGKGALVAPLTDALKREGADSPTGKNFLGALQKLSLRRGAQSAMIRAGIIKFLLPVLSSPHSLSEYALEYASALLMNLLLRTAGRQQTLDHPDVILSVLEGLVRIPSPEVKTYANGALYSVLSEPRIRRRAQQLGLGDLLVEIRAQCDAYLAKQVDYVLTQLESHEVPAISDTVSEDGQDEDYEDDNEQNEVGEEDLDDELLSHTSQGDAIGDELLALRYAASGKPPVPGGSNPGLARPVPDVALIRSPPRRDFEEDFAVELRRPRTPSRPSSRPATRPSTPASTRPSTAAGRAASGVRNGQSDVPPSTASSKHLVPRSAENAGRNIEDMRHKGVHGEEQGFTTRTRILRTPLSQ